MSFTDTGTSFSSVDSFNDMPKNFRVKYRPKGGKTKGRWAEAVACKQLLPETQSVCSMVSMALDLEREALVSELERRHRALLQSVSDHMERMSLAGSKTSFSPMPSKHAPMAHLMHKLPPVTSGPARAGEANLEDDTLQQEAGKIPVSKDGPFLEPLPPLLGTPVAEPAVVDAKPAESEDTKAMAKTANMQSRVTAMVGIGSNSHSVLRGRDDIGRAPLWYPSEIVKHPAFDAFFCGVIILNCAVMFFEFQYQGFETGYYIGYPNFDTNAKDTWPGAHEAFRVIELIFGVTFTIEVLIKIAGQKLKFPCYTWNWIDTVIVACWAIDAIFSGAVALPVPPTMMRLVRLARTLRLVRLMRTVKNFDALYIMTTAIYGSFSILSWCFILLMMVQTACAFVLNQLLKENLMDTESKLSDEARRQIFQYFGTTWRALFTMFELTLGNWVVPARILQEHVGGIYCAFVVVFKLCIGFGVLGVVNGVFTQETFKVAAADNRIMMRQKERDIKHHTHKMQQLFSAADESGDGLLDIDEFEAVLSHPETKLWLSAQDISFRDPGELFKLIEDGQGQVTAEGLVMGVARLKGAAKQLDLISLQREQELFRQRVAKKLAIEA
eukprot:TRINITY_DN72417_c0_g1_i1.p1 TRINITY_DN72417_c0_g1~~TRINITY_DN72417_c0_g1_i1.p1  ORF type:complete len:611 (+),score=103.49 TRINITY_DN72417_c0_g1_i1:42-1874(+)